MCTTQLPNVLNHLPELHPGTREILQQRKHLFWCPQKKAFGDILCCEYSDITVRTSSALSRISQLSSLSFAASRGQRSDIDVLLVSSTNSARFGDMYLAIDRLISFKDWTSSWKENGIIPFESNKFCFYFYHFWNIKCTFKVQPNDLFAG